MSNKRNQLYSNPIFYTNEGKLEFKQRIPIAPLPSISVSLPTVKNVLSISDMSTYHRQKLINTFD